MCVSEYYKDRLEDFISTDTFNRYIHKIYFTIIITVRGEIVKALLFSFPRVSKLAEVSHQILSGLGYLHQRKICVRNLSPETILLTTEVN